MINFSDLFDKRAKSSLKASDVLSHSELANHILNRFEKPSLSYQQFETHDFSQTISILDQCDPFDEILRNYADERIHLLELKHEGKWDKNQEVRFNHLSDLIERYFDRDKEINLEMKYSLLVESLTLLQATSQVVRHFKRRLK